MDHFNNVKAFRAIERGLVELINHGTESERKMRRNALGQSFCLICDVGEDWSKKVREVFIREGIDPLFVIATLAAASITEETRYDGSLNFNPLRMGDKGELVISSNDRHGCISGKEFLDTLARIWPDQY